MTTIDQWESEAHQGKQVQISCPTGKPGCLVFHSIRFQDEKDKRILDLINLVRKKDESMRWIMPKVHQGNHEGGLESCTKSTCIEYRKALALIEDLK